MMMQCTEPPVLAGQDLTPRQRSIVQVIEESIRRYGYAPTLREIGEAVGLASTSSISHQLSRLETKGYLSRGAGRPRTAVVLPLTDPAIEQHADHAHGDIEGAQEPAPHYGKAGRRGPGTSI